MYVKICGLRTAEHARVAVDAGAAAVGVVMNRTSSRRATEDEAREVVAAARGRADTVLVVNDMPADQAARTARDLGFDVLQLHGRAYAETDFGAATAIVPRVWRATSLDLDPPLQVGAWGEEMLLLDAPKPGSGEQWDLSELADRAPEGRWLLAGGLSAGNVAGAIAVVRPWGVDVSSGVEVAPGEKSADLIHRFAAAALGG
ncbi:phosphoribosylanthranilate isomerase [Aeromicrobium duanguangcaii]|uniref:N-(5'-phosphoribosyl)anthranilate isomerase n=1 Tax=Aeromicrobium duanguangcaii TaxID=2968086 RepID=A0ABY5KHI0_9ACTN|nr:phosphoribosylanthranilate isomerase [Aeromicrobium duanguangcaii]MCD9153099.1 phosphoribosylanthranilate isomerase [Aeromicrobium duanguangcaii]UUI69800.1 phosphoribosylanthranilate isomerase [Aeromicrobium duanguangcaii]